MTDPQPTTDPTEPSPNPGPPAPAGEAPEGKPGAPRDLEKELRDLQSSLRSERQHRANAEKKLSESQQAAMSDSEKAVASARDEGRQAALQDVGARLAAAEFVAEAAGKLGDVGPLVKMLDMRQFLGDDGEPNGEAIAGAVAALAAALPPKPVAPAVPNGARGDSVPDGDWLRAKATGRA